MSDVRTYDGLDVLPAELPDLLEETCLRSAAIGAELGGELQLNLPVVHFRALQQSLPQARFEDLSPFVWALRSVKSAAEIDRHRQACRITSQAYEAVFAATGAGDTQRDVARRLRVEMVERGGADPFVLINSGAGTYDHTTGLPSDRELAAGDLLWLDCGCAVDGYWSDFSRAAVVGSPSPEQQRMHDRIEAITAAAVERIRPGLPCSELARFCAGELQSLPATASCVISDLAGRVGHSVGLAVTEPPHISGHEDVALQAGMVVTVEPGVATEYGTFHVEANCVVTPTGVEVLSTAPTGLRSL